MSSGNQKYQELIQAAVAERGWIYSKRAGQKIVADVMNKERGELPAATQQVYDFIRGIAQEIEASE